MSQKGFIATLLRRLNRVRQGHSQDDSQYWATCVNGMISAAFLLDAISFEERDRLDELAASALNSRQAELRAQGVFV